MLRIHPYIFIVEDDPVYTKVITHKLTSSGFTKFTSFTSGEAALEQLNQNPDFVILDFSLDGLNGLDTLKAIRERNRKVKVIVLTSVKNSELAEKCLISGAQDYLEKSADSLDSIIQELSASRSRRIRTWILALGIVTVITVITLLMI